MILIYHFYAQMCQMQGHPQLIIMRVYNSIYTYIFFTHIIYIEGS